MSGRRGGVLRIAHAVAMAVFAVAGLVTLVTGGVLANRSLPLGLGFAAVAAVTFVGLWRSSRVALALGGAGMVLGPVVAGRLGAAVDPASHLTTALGVGLAYAVWLATRAHRPGAPDAD